MSGSSVTTDTARANGGPMVDPELVRGLLVGLPIPLLFWASVLALAL